MPQISKVGDGWITPDYVDLATWQAAEAGVEYGIGTPAEAACKGFCGEGNLNGTFPNGALVYTDNAIYDGTNDTQLATVNRLKLNNAGIIAKHIKCLNTFTWDYALTSNGVGSYAQYCFVEDTSGGTYGAVDVYGTGDGKVINCVIKTNSAQAFRVGYNRPYQIENNIVFGATGTALTKSGTTGQIARNNFFFSNAIDYGAKAAIFENNASQDLTGSSGLTGYTSAELVDFANGDYRVKSTSPLATAGVGAFIEASSVPSDFYTGDVSPAFSIIATCDGIKGSYIDNSTLVVVDATITTLKRAFVDVISDSYYSLDNNGYKRIASGVLSVFSQVLDVGARKSSYTFTSCYQSSNSVIDGSKSTRGNLNIVDSFLSSMYLTKRALFDLSSSSLFAVSVHFEKSVSHALSLSVGFFHSIDGFNGESAPAPTISFIYIDGRIDDVKIHSNIFSEVYINGDI